MTRPGNGMNKTLPGLEDFCMIGQWVEPGGGVPTAASSARQALQAICTQEGREFTAFNTVILGAKRSRESLGAGR